MFWQYLAQHVKSRLAYGWDLAAGIGFDLVYQAVSMIFLLVIFGQVPLLAGWNRAETIFIFGFFGLPYTAFGLISGGLWNFADQYIVRGELDRLLLRPVHALYQVILEGVDLDAVSGVISGVALMTWASGQLHLHWRWYDLPLLLVLVAGATLVYCGVYLLLACVAFWTDSPTGLISLAWNLNQYGRYPVTIYNRLWRFVLSWILPFAFVAAYPASIFLRRADFWRFALATPLVGGALFGLALLVWRAGLRRYHGAGS